MKYEREKKENLPVAAICYDFDKTLSPDNMQAYGYIQDLGYDIEAFWKDMNVDAEKNEMDANLASMYKIMAEAVKNNKITLTKQTLKNYGARVQLFKGVEDWFDRISAYGAAHGVIVEHYIISSGIKAMIEGTSIADKFKRIFASSFYYNDKDEPVWPAQAINATNKTQFLFRIEKGILNVNDDGVMEHFKDDALRVPFSHMIYLGDSYTDIPCMRLVNKYHGYSIGVYNPETNDQAKVRELFLEDRIRFFAPADYSKDSPLDQLVKAIIERIAADEVLRRLHEENRRIACEEAPEDADEWA